ncbi:MAG: hypothetical protein ACTSRG_11310 [Candidatus Helarchaeota archaeon]
MPVEKLGWFRKKLAGLGKRIYFRKSHRINLFSVNSMVRNVVRIYADINNGDYEKAILDFCEQIEEESNNIIAEMIDTPIMLGTSLKTILAKDPDDLPFISTTLFWALLGKDYQDLWDELKVIKEEKGVIKLVMREKSCLLCIEERELTQKDFGNANLGDIISAIFKGIIQALQDYVGNKFDVTAKETKCFLRGDSYGEITVILTPID